LGLFEFSGFTQSACPDQLFQEFPGHANLRGDLGLSPLIAAAADRRPRGEHR
jgi:hypothetical protein